MVVLGQWPYEHVITLNALHRTTGNIMYYYVDEDRIIDQREADTLVADGFVLDDVLYTIMSSDINSYVGSYRDQVRAPPVHPDLVELYDAGRDPVLTELITKVQISGAVLIVNDQAKDIMLDVGADWNQYIGMWILDANHLKLLRERRREKYKGKVEIVQARDGLFIEVRGDVSLHVNLLQSVGGTYDQQKDVWYVPTNKADRIMHIAK